MCCHLGVRGSLSTQWRREGVPGGPSAGLPSRVELRRGPGTREKAPRGEQAACRRRPSPAGPSSVCFAPSSTACSKWTNWSAASPGSWRASPPAHGPAPPEQLHSEGGDLLARPILRPALLLPLRTPSPSGLSCLQQQEARCRPSSGSPRDPVRGGALLLSAPASQQRVPVALRQPPSAGQPVSG